MTDYIQEKFEEWFVREKQLKNDEWKRKDHSGDYVNVIIQDHYDCFVEGWIAGWNATMDDIKEGLDANRNDY